jgi:hypothetical protein
MPFVEKWSEAGLAQAKRETLDRRLIPAGVRKEDVVLEPRSGGVPGPSQHFLPSAVTGRSISLESRAGFSWNLRGEARTRQADVDTPVSRRQCSNRSVPSAQDRTRRGKLVHAPRASGTCPAKRGFKSPRRRQCLISVVRPQRDSKLSGALRRQPWHDADLLRPDTHRRHPVTSALEVQTPPAMRSKGPERRHGNESGRVGRAASFQMQQAPSPCTNGSRAVLSSRHRRAQPGHSRIESLRRKPVPILI